MHSNPDTLNETCICDEGEVCTHCASPDLVMLVQLKLSMPWALSAPELRERSTAQEFLAATAANN
jgi:hypothetical protein